MGEIKHIKIPLDSRDIDGLKAGDMVLLSGQMFTARDQAHLRLCALIEEQKELPVDLAGKVIYYCGPTPVDNGVIGACGPTTSSRMDLFTPCILKKGVRGLIGKGTRSPEVVEAIKETNSVYFAAPGGAGAYLSEKVIKAEIVAFEDLGPEAIYSLEVVDFPVIVAVDQAGNDLYEKFGEDPNRKHKNGK